jgi:hypothetical protein
VTTKFHTATPEELTSNDAKWLAVKLRHLARLVRDGDPKAHDMARDLLAKNGRDITRRARVRLVDGALLWKDAGWMIRFWVEVFAESFVASGAENYLAADFKVAGEAEPTFAVVLQRCAGLTLDQRRLRAEKERDEALAKLAKAEREIARLKATR